MLEGIVGKDIKAYTADEAHETAVADDGTKVKIKWTHRINITGRRLTDPIDQTDKKRHTYVFFAEDYPDVKTELRNGMPKPDDNVRAWCFPKNLKGDLRPCLMWIEIV